MFGNRSRADEKPSHRQWLHLTQQAIDASSNLHSFRFGSRFQLLRCRCVGVAGEKAQNDVDDMDAAFREPVMIGQITLKHDREGVLV